MQNSLSGISGLSGLGSLSKGVKEMINQNQDVIDRILKDEKLNGLGKINKGEEKLSFMQVVDQYNDGISTDEIKAWIYYKRKQGIPMKGWRVHIPRILSTPFRFKLSSPFRLKVSSHF